MNLCPPCGEDFSSVEAFDLHRVGDHRYSFEEGMSLDPPREDGRRCLTAVEMSARGWDYDARRRWVHPREARKRASRGGDSFQDASDGHQANPTTLRVARPRRNAITAAPRPTQSEAEIRTSER